jgi:UDP-glucuronate 4-epimerase
LNHQPIQIFNQGQLSRDFTYIDDIVQAILKLVDLVNLKPDEFEHHNIYNIGHHQPVSLEEFISTLEDLLNVKVIREYVDMQQGDVLTTYADISKLDALIGYRPTTTLREGLSHFIKWYKKHKGDSL